jgi:hypothetical protein
MDGQLMGYERASLVTRSPGKPIKVMALTNVAEAWLTFLLRHGAGGSALNAGMPQGNDADECPKRLARLIRSHMGLAHGADAQDNEAS